MPSPEAIKAMERIAREKAGWPEGAVAARKLAALEARGMRPIGKVRLGGRSTEGLELHFTFDMSEFQRGMDDLADRIRRRMAEEIDEWMMKGHSGGAT